MSAVSGIRGARGARCLRRFRSTSRFIAAVAAVTVVTLASCGHPPGSGPAQTAAQAPAPCCTTFEQVREHDGDRVRFRGTYAKVRVVKGDGGDPVDLDSPGTVQVSAGAVTVMLGIYYDDASARPVEEIRALHGRRVEVIGVLHARTPSRMGPSGAAMATMIGPYIDVDSIRPVE